MSEDTERNPAATRSQQAGWSAWLPALDVEGESREGAWVAELPLPLLGWPPGTRAICRRERPHPGAQLSFTDHDGHRFQVLLTNQTGERIVRHEQLHRQRAAIEDAIRCAKASGLRNLPFRAYAMNSNSTEGVGPYTTTGLDSRGAQHCIVNEMREMLGLGRPEDSL